MAGCDQYTAFGKGNLSPSQTDQSCSVKITFVQLSPIINGGEDGRRTEAVRWQEKQILLINTFLPFSLYFSGYIPGDLSSCFAEGIRLKYC